MAHQREANRGDGLQQRLLIRDTPSGKDGRGHRHRRKGSGKLLRGVDMRGRASQRRAVELGDRAEAVVDAADAKVRQCSRHPRRDETLFADRDADVTGNVQMERRRSRSRGSAGVCRQ